ncbi:MAG: GyrI-like domain-containing protein [Candidatus Promineifilaceae bacterium]|nr:GyrI-like domain-containing protein [Candidatus Promineifilaceae bacterium]
MTAKVELQEKGHQHTVVIRDKVARKEIDTHLAQLIPLVQEHLEKKGVTPAGRPFARYHNFGPVERINVDLEVGFPVATPVEGESSQEGEVEVVPSELPGCQAAVVHYRGPYTEIGAAYDVLQEWIQAQDYESDGTPWESYHSDLTGEDVNDVWEVAVYWPVKATGAQ